MNRAAGAMGETGWHQPPTLPLMLLISLLLHGALAFYWPANLSSASNPSSVPGSDIRMHIQRTLPVAQQPMQEATREPTVAGLAPKPAPEPAEVSKPEPDMTMIQPEPQPEITRQPQHLVETKPEPLTKPEAATIDSTPKVSRQRPVKPRSRQDRQTKRQPATGTPEPQLEVTATANPVKPKPTNPVQGATTAETKTSASEPVAEPQQQQATRLMIIDWLQEELKQHFRYPRQARRRGWQGTVMLEFTVASRGGITDIRISESSGYRLLDRNAEKTLQRIASSGMASMPFVGQTMSLAVPVSYRLR